MTDHSNNPEVQMSRLPIGQEVPFNLTEGPIDIRMGNTYLTVVDPERDLPAEQSSKFNRSIGALIVSQEIGEKDIDEGRGYKGLRDDEKVVIGRNHPSRNRFKLDSGVSRNHLDIWRDGDTVYVRDLGSTNGTLAGQRALKSRRGLHHLMSELIPGPESKYPYSVTAGGGTEASEHHPDYNDDAWFIDTDSLAFGVFDGVGGLPGSSQASGIASETIKEFLKGVPVDTPQSLVLQQLSDALKAGHEAILSQPTRKIATTATIAKLIVNSNGEQFAAVASAGDSRAYLYHDGELKMLTMDHGAIVNGTDSEKLALQETFANVVDISKLSDEERDIFNRRNIIYSALGDLDNFSISGTIVRVEPGDKILLTTDGIHDNLTTEEINEWVKLNINDGEIAGGLIRSAQQRSRNSGHIRAKKDDMTAVLVAIGN